MIASPYQVRRFLEEACEVAAGASIPMRDLVAHYNRRVNPPVRMQCRRLTRMLARMNFKVRNVRRGDRVSSELLGYALRQDLDARRAA
jgi:hypothetical protein